MQCQYEIRPNTHDVNPCPSAGIVAAVSASQLNHDDRPYDGDHAAPEYPQHCLASPLCLPDLKAPDPRVELAVADYAHDRTMRREQEVVEAHSRLRRFWVPMRILGSYGRRVQERRGGNSVHAEAEDVERGEVYGEAERRLARIVRDRLRVEAARLPAVTRDIAFAKASSSAEVMVGSSLVVEGATSKDTRVAIGRSGASDKGALLRLKEGGVAWRHRGRAPDFET
ncbi:hypothetical protein OPT61_g9050 [Boeremia exigua]|uniref:Uncharacterized protein n=1 Tax=Boeremia exigua TaxID=749465 RepID=A0ACC2HVP5_9PLEO|nr:hypothetical protein OPT61_g9050 [Boeremia exigua]